MEFLPQFDFANTGMLLGIASLAVACLVLQGRLRRAETRLADMYARAEQSHSDVSALCTGAVGVARRLNRIEGKLRIQHERQDMLEMQEPNYQVYGQAVKMAKKGADLDELVNTYGLSRGEAELIVMLNSNAIQH